MTKQHPAETGAPQTTGSSQPPAEAEVHAQPVLPPVLPKQEPETRDALPLSWQEKLSIWGIVVFLVAPLLMLAGMGMLSFLWFADASNPTWRDLILRNWLTRAVAITAEALKQAVTFQTGIMVAMLASLVLERSEATLPHLASFTMMRATAGSGTIAVMLWNYLSGTFWHARFRGSLVFMLVLVTTLNLGLTRAISILLLSDIGLVTVPGATTAVNTSFAFSNRFPPNSTGFDPVSRVIERSGTWFRKAQGYPTFAEHSEPPYEAEGVSDTGVTLRAFLPFQSAQDRQTLMSYSGHTVVMDSRVTCQIPAFLDPRIQLMSGLADFLVVEGGVGASRSTPRLGNRTTTFEVKNGSVTEVYNRPVGFSCLAPLGPVSRTSTGPAYETDQWRLSICQLPEGRGDGPSFYAGGLVSEFKDLDTWAYKVSHRFTDRRSTTYGAAYLLFNVTTGIQGSWQAVVADDTRGRGYSPPAYSHRGEWLDLVFSEGTLVLSATLCYAAFDFANLAVYITSAANRTEPEAIWDPAIGRYTFDSVRTAMGQHKDQDRTTRGILDLHARANWTATYDEAPDGLEPFMRAFADLSLGIIPTTAVGSGNYGNASGILTTKSTCPSPFGNTTLERLRDVCATPEIMHLWFAQEMLRTGASPAFVLQSMQTLLAGMAYYDQIGQFDNATVAERTFFVVANVAVTAQGFVAVAVVLAVHLLLAAAVLVLFLSGTRLSRVGATWSALAQALGGEGTPYVGRAALVGDGDVDEMMKKDGVQSVRVGLQRRDGNVVVTAADTGRGNADRGKRRKRKHLRGSDA